MKKYLVRTTTGKWDEVTEYVFQHRKWVVNPETGDARYGSETIVSDGNGLEIHGKIGQEELGKLLRFFGVTAPVGTFTPLVNEPETVQIVRGNVTKLHVLATGENWTKTSSKKKEQPAERIAA